MASFPAPDVTSAYYHGVTPDAEAADDDDASLPSFSSEPSCSGTGPSID
jgi:hypothetical protein